MAAHFGDDLKFSHDQANAPFWEEVYRRAWPDFASMVSVRKDGWAQRGGIDRSVTTFSGVTYWIDEKVRRKLYEVDDRFRTKYFPSGATVFPDILLEIFSDQEKRTPGWVVKDLACHYIAYAILPIKQVYLLPVSPLQKAWRDNEQKWLQEFGKRPSKNEYNGRRWTTLNCPVPVPVLMYSIARAMAFTFESEPLRKDSHASQAPIESMVLTNGTAKPQVWPVSQLLPGFE